MSGKAILKSNITLIMAIALIAVGQFYIYQNSSCYGGLANNLWWPITALTGLTFSLIAYRLVTKLLSKHKKASVIILIMLIVATFVGALILTWFNAWHKAGFHCLTF
jgi:FtsH-binding integral membrane protein